MDNQSPTAAREAEAREFLREMALTAQQGSKRIRGLWVPTDFAPGDAAEVYILHAQHRGDMYHVRVAMALKPRPLIIHSCPDAGSDLMDYLSRGLNSTAVYMTKLGWDQLTAKNAPNKDTVKKTFKLYSEGICSVVIWDAVNNGATLEQVREAVCRIDPSEKESIEAEFAKLCSKLFGVRNTNETTVLVNYRDTGTKGGVYPELDSGEQSIVDISTAIESMPGSEGKKLKVVMCGNPEPLGKFHSIGEYFKGIPSGSWPKSTKRDIEAFFFLYAFQNNFYRMSVGFRSGVMDLFTFLNIPSISISIRQYIGEDRHAFLAINPLFKRWNVQYEMPRHITTRFIPKTYKFCASPWWQFTGKEKSPPTDKEKAEHLSPLGNFSDFDKIIIQEGLYRGITQLLPWPTKITLVNVEETREYNSALCRKTYFSDMPQKGEVEKYIQHKRQLEGHNIEIRTKWADERYEPLKDIKTLQVEMEADYEGVLKHLASK